MNDIDVYNLRARMKKLLPELREDGDFLSPNLHVTDIDSYRAGMEVIVTCITRITGVNFETIL